MPRRTIGGRYELEQPLGGGAMSSVWLAHDHELDRKVAVKLLAGDADHARFEREARAVAALGHPNICQLYDYGESDEGPYMVLEYLPGGTLEDLLAGGTILADADAFRISQEIAAGLAHAHERGLVHRDLKPANILFDGEQRAKIADFGIARIEGGNELTVAGTVLGTAAYLSPEQAAGLPASPASDVYSFGVIVFRMLTGRPPFVADTAMELVRLHQEAEPPRIEDLRQDAPPTLASLAVAALAKDPAARPPDGAALLAALSGSDDRTLLTAPAARESFGADWAAAGATQVIPRARPSRRRATPLVVALAAAALAVVGIAAAVLVTGSPNGGGAGTSAPASLSLPTVGKDSTSGSTSFTTTTGSTSSTSSTRSTTTTPAAPRTTSAPAPAPVPATTAPLTTTTAAITTTPPIPATTAPPTTSTADTTATTTTTTTTTP